MFSEPVMYEEDGAIARVTLRESAGAAGNVWESLRAAFETIEASDAVRAALISGAAGAFAFDMPSQARGLSVKHKEVGAEAALSVLWTAAR